MYNRSNGLTTRCSEKGKSNQMLKQKSSAEAGEMKNAK